MEKKIKEVAIKIFELFFFNSRAYGMQVNIDGAFKYLTTYKNIDANILRYFFENKEAIMCYQQNFDLLKWICLDFDICKSKIDSIEGDYDFFKDENFRKELEYNVQLTIDLLESLGISYLLEFSGNRGIHIWLHFKTEITKRLGNAILDSIIEKIEYKSIYGMTPTIIIDKYPKTGKSKGNKVGLGVKIPLSFHKKSKRYSYLVDSISEITQIEEIDEKLLEKQINIFKKYKCNNVKDVITSLSIVETVLDQEYDKYSGLFTAQTDLDHVIIMLSKCSIYKEIFSKPVKALRESDRLVITGTLAKLKTANNPIYGLELLKEFFARDRDGYNEEITTEKLESLKHLFPPRISYLEKLYRIECNYCKENDISNSIQLLDDLNIEESSSLIPLIKKSQYGEKHYLLHNDEVPLNHIYDEISRLNLEKIEDDIKKIQSGEYKLKLESYKYKRVEETKDRFLYSLSAKDRVLSTTIMKLLNGFIAGEYSTSKSYSYRLNEEWFNNEIFINWNTLWMEFNKKIEDIVLSPSYENYYAIKLDIHSFYDSINLTYLRGILYEDTTSKLKQILNELPDTSANCYKNYCNYLIEICETINKKGVPQGPAFARYLAELYLFRVDEYITEKLDPNLESFYRYVDDFIIFVETEEKGKEIIEGIKNKLGVLKLELNNKQMFGKVSDLRENLLNLQLEKYFIDNLSESTPSSVKNKIRQELNTFFLNVTDENDYKNLPFYLTHFIDSDLIDERKDKIIHAVINGKYGRGSTYKHFFKNIVFAYDNPNLSFYKNISGLCRSNFINQLNYNSNKIDPDQLNEIITYFLSIEIEEYEKIELLRLLLLTGISTTNDFGHSDYIIMLNLINSLDKIIIPASLHSQLFDTIQGISNEYKKFEVLDDIFSKSASLSDFNKAKDTCFIILETYLRNNTEKIESDNIYSLVCFFTLYANNYAQVSTLWNFMCDKIDQQSIPENNWYRYKLLISNNEIKHEIVTTFITNTVQNLGVNPQVGVREIESRFTYSLFLFLYSNENKSQLNENLLNKLREIAQTKKIHFINWCLDNAEFYPNRDFAINNIQYNNRLVLKKGNELLVRAKNESLINYKNKLLETEELNFTNMGYVKLDIGTDPLQNIEQKLSSMAYNLFDAVSFICHITNVFDNENITFNVFEMGTFSQNSIDIRFLYSANDKKIIMNNNQVIENTRNNILKETLDLFEKSNIQVTLTSGYSINSKKFLKRLFPTRKSLLRIESKLEYLQEFEKLFAKGIPVDQFQLEVFFIQVLREKCIKNSDFIKEFRFLEDYIQTVVKTPNECLLFSKCEIKVETLQYLLNSLKESIVGNHLYIDSDNFVLNGINKVFKQIYDNPDILKCEVKESNISHDLIMINNNSLKISEIMHYEIGQDGPITELKESKVLSITGSSYNYFKDTTLYTIPSFIETCIEIINNKDGNSDISKLELDASLQSLDKFELAIGNIQKQQNIDERTARFRLVNFLKLIDEKYHTSIVRLIARYKVITDDEFTIFKEKLVTALENPDACVLPLKNHVLDRNGLFMLLNEKAQTEFDRGSKNDRIMDNSYKQIKKGLTNLTIITDIGLSGSQFSNVINNYCADTNDIEIHYKKLEKEKLFQINPSDFKESLQSLTKVDILCIFYTPTFKTNVIKKLKEIGVLEERIFFLGNEINEDLYMFKSMDRTDRDKIVECIRNSSFIKLGLPLCSFEQYLETIDNNDTRNMLIARYKSLPKYHFPFLHKYRLFYYRKDKN